MKSLKNLSFISGDSQLANLIREKDWSATSFGPIESWSQALKTAIGMMLNSHFPVYIVWGKDFRQIYNDAYLSILRNRHPSALGERSEVTWSDLWETISPMYQSVLETGKSIGFNDLLLPHFKNDVWEDAYFSFSYNPIWNEQNEVEGIIVSCEETTQKILNQLQIEDNIKTLKLSAEKELKARKELDDVLENMNDAFFTLDENFVIQRVNERFEQITLKNRANIVGENFLDLFFYTPELKKSKYFDTYSRVMLERKPEFFIEHYAPLNIWTAVSVYPKSDKGIAAFFKEVTEERLAAKALEDAVRSRDEFLSIAGHELRTPITSMKLQAQLMERSLAKKDSSALDASRVLKLIKQMNHGVERVDRLVSDMLDISRINAGKLTIQQEIENLVSSVDEIVDRFSEQLTAAGIKLTFKADNESIPVLIDYFRMEQVLANLLTNAIRYAPQGPVSITLDSTNEKYVTLSFEDSGRGIDETDRVRIFERFERSITNGISGFGLGLYIVKEIILAHHGKIHVEEGSAGGARFVINLPK